VTFEEHLENNRRTDGGYDFDGAEEDRRHEIETSPEEHIKLAAKAAKQEREAYLRQETAKLRKQFEQPALSASLELDVIVPLGDSTGVRLRDMNHIRIRTRKDMRTQTHINELRAFDAEMTHWLHTEPLLNNGETIGDAIARGGTP
jgi:hypothetical protein